MSRQYKNFFGSLIALTVAAASIYACGSEEEFNDTFAGAGSATGYTPPAPQKFTTGAAMDSVTTATDTIDFVAANFRMADGSSQQGVLYAARSEGGLPAAGTHDVARGTPAGALDLGPYFLPAMSPWGCQLSGGYFPGCRLFQTAQGPRIACSCMPNLAFNYISTGLMNHVSRVCLPGTNGSFCTMACFPQNLTCDMAIYITDRVGQSVNTSFDVACDGPIVSETDVQIILSRVTQSCARTIIARQPQIPQEPSCTDTPNWALPYCGSDRMVVCNTQATPPRYECRDTPGKKPGNPPPNPECPGPHNCESGIPLCHNGSWVCAMY